MLLYAAPSAKGFSAVNIHAATVLLLPLLLLLQVPVPWSNHAAVRCTFGKGVEPRGNDLCWPPRQQADAARDTTAATRTQLVRVYVQNHHQKRASCVVLLQRC
jgi:hypothetical protein